MQSVLVTKYEFRIRTRNGAVVENLVILGQDEDEARRKLLQMYRGCEIMESRSVKANLASRTTHVSYEDVMDLIIAG